MIGTAPSGSMNLADVYGQPSHQIAAPALLSSFGPNQSAVAAGVNVFGNTAQGSAPAWALILILAVLVGMRVAFEFSTKGR